MRPTDQPAPPNRGAVPRPLAVVRSRSILVMLVVTFGWTWTLEFVGIARQDGERSIEAMAGWLIVASFGPTVGAVVAAASEGRLRALRGRFGPLRQRWWVWLVASYAMVPATTLCLLAFSGGELAAAASESALLVFLPLVGLFSIVGGPLGEELGWRGVLLPWALQRWSWLTSAIVVGLLWAVWHLPLWTLDDFIPDLAATTFIPLYVVSIVAFSVVMTVLQHHSAHSVLIAMLAHGAFNSVLLPVEALRDEGILRVAIAWPFTAATVLTAVAAIAIAARRRTSIVEPVRLAADESA